MNKSSPLGETRIMNNGQKATCIRYRNYFDIDIQFEDGTIVRNIRKDAFYSGSVKNPNIKEIVSTSILGVKRLMTNGQYATCIAYRRFNDIDVQFEDGTIVEHKRKDSFLSGGIENPNYNPSSCVGLTLKMNCGMNATCIAYRKYSDIDIQFEDGTILEHINAGNFIKKAILHPSIKSDCVGEARTMNNSQKATCIAYRKATDIDIQFEDGTIIEHCSKSNFYSGKIKNPNYLDNDEIKKPTTRYSLGDPSKSNCVGETRTMRNGQKATCIAYRKASDIDVQFEDGYIARNKGKDAFYSGLIRNPKYAVTLFIERNEKKIKDLSTEWNTDKNGGSLIDCLYNIGLKLRGWWLLPFDDPKTGKHFDFEWQSALKDRINGRGCPYTSNKKVWIGYNDFETVYPELAKEWHPTKNGNLRPNQVIANSGQTVWWLMPYDDLNTGKHFEFEWKARVYSRVRSGCPFTSKPYKALYKGFNDLGTLYPQLAKEWHPTKNGDHNPSEYLPGSSFDAWWLMPYDDPKTGKHFEFEWKMKIIVRTSNGLGCPYLSNQKLWPGFNDLETTNPELLQSWDYSKNKISPSATSIGSKSKYWWVCNKCRHSWETTPYNRSRTECPNCNNYLSSSFPEQAIYYFVKRYFSDAINRDKTLGFELDIFIPSINCAIEYDGKRWHQDISRDLEKINKCKDIVRLIRVREKGCPRLTSNDCEIIQTSGNIDTSLEKAIVKVLELLGVENPIVDIKSNKNEIISNYRKGVLDDSLATLYPNIAKEWHPTKNGKLKPENFPAKSNHVAWWLMPYDDPKTGKHFDFEWQAPICHRVDGIGCPYLKNRKILKGFNDAVTSYPQILDEWDFSSNSKSPYEISPGSEYKANFICKKCGKKYSMYVYHFTEGRRCPHCNTRKFGRGKKVVCIETGVIYNSIREASLKTGTDNMGICNCCKGKIKTSNGFHWKYVD